MHYDIKSDLLVHKSMCSNSDLRVEEASRSGKEKKIQNLLKLSGLKPDSAIRVKSKYGEPW